MKWRCIGSTSLGSHLRTGVEEESLRVKRDEEKRNAKHGERMNGQTRAEREEVEAKVIRFVRWRDHFFRRAFFASPRTTMTGRLLAPRQGSTVIFIYELLLSPATNFIISLVSETGRSSELADRDSQAREVRGRGMRSERKALKTSRQKSLQRFFRDFIARQILATNCGTERPDITSPQIL